MGIKCSASENIPFLQNSPNEEAEKTVTWHWTPDPSTASEDRRKHPESEIQNCRQKDTDTRMEWWENWLNLGKK